MRNREYDREYGKKWHAENRDEENRKSREWQRQNREKRAAYMRDWNAKQRSVDPVNHSKKIRQTTLKRKYGITHEQYEEMLQRQGGHCALCERTPDKERHGKLNVDH